MLKIQCNKVWKKFVIVMGCMCAVAMQLHFSLSFFDKPTTTTSQSDKTNDPVSDPDPAHHHLSLLRRTTTTNRTSSRSPSADDSTHDKNNNNSSSSSSSKEHTLNQGHALKQNSTSKVSQVMGSRNGSEINSAQGNLSISKNATNESSDLTSRWNKTLASTATTTLQQQQQQQQSMLLNNNASVQDSNNQSTTNLANNTVAPSHELADAHTKASQIASPSASSMASDSTLQGNNQMQQQEQLDWSRVQDINRLKEPFQRYDHVVVATKVKGPNWLSQLKQMLCLFTAAYNRHVNYNIVVFTTLPWESHQIQELQAIVPNVKLTVVLEGPPLEERLALMTPAERERLYQRCGAVNRELTWEHFCPEEVNTTRFIVSLGYAWQAEFRAYHLWKQPSLAKYKYMIWIDSDALATKPWDKDPMKLFIENDLVIMFDHDSGDSSDNRELANKMHKSYNKTICRISLENGHLNPHFSCPNDSFSVALVHGFFHITNLDFYRSERSSRFLETLVETQKYSREWDDQIAITIPAAIDAPERSWDMRSHGLHMGILHNGYMDGQGNEVPVKDDKYTTYWNETVKHEWDAAREMCNHLVKHPG